jgi:hypothetical protein
MIHRLPLETVMTNRSPQSRIDGRRLLMWCGFAAFAGLFVGTAIGVAAIVQR